MAIAVDNLADAESLTEAEEEDKEEKERTKELRRSKSKTPTLEEKEGEVRVNQIIISASIDSSLAKIIMRPL